MSSRKGVRVILVCLFVAIPQVTPRCIPDSMPCASFDSLDSDIPLCCSGRCTESTVLGFRNRRYCEPNTELVQAKHNDDAIKYSFERFKNMYPDRPAVRLGYPDSHSFTWFVRNSITVSQLQALFEDQDVDFSVFDSPLGDLDPMELRRSMLMAPSPPPLPQEERGKSQVSNPTSSLLRGSMQDPTPKEWDWTSKGAVGPVRDQGALGTCWAFSASANVEGQLFIKHGHLPQLSVEQLIECDSMSDPANPDADCGEFGGWPYLGFEYMERTGGLVTEAELPYCAGEVDRETKLPKCFPCMAKKYNKSKCGDHSDLYCKPETTKGQGAEQMCAKLDQHNLPVAAHVTGWRAIATDETKIASELYQTGPLSVAMNAQLLSFYKHGVFNPPKWLCNPSSLDHAVLLTGFGGGTERTDTVAYQRLLDAAQPAEQVDALGRKKNTLYWTVKNSWGGKWGEQGYFRIARGIGACGINTAVATATLD